VECFGHSGAHSILPIYGSTSPAQDFRKLKNFDKNQQKPLYYHGYITISCNQVPLGTKITCCLWEMVTTQKF